MITFIIATWAFAFSLSPPVPEPCMFTARPDLDPSLEQRFAEALSGMSYDNPSHRAVLDAEGLRRWEPPHLDGYDFLRQASARQGFFKPPTDTSDGAVEDVGAEPPGCASRDPQR